MPDQSVVTGATVAAISFETTPDQARTLLPRFFRPAEKPILSFTWIDYPSLEYLGGRGYKELVVAVSAVFAGRDGDVRATFAPVMWVDQAGALISGREFMGFGKLFATFAIEQDETGIRWRCREYEDPLVEAELTNLQPVSNDGLGRINDSAAAIGTFGWKYIASDMGAPDADYPIMNVTRWHYTDAWTADARLDLHSPTAAGAPFSSRVIAGLRSLSLGKCRKGFVARGNVVIDRTATHRLEWAER